MKQTNFFRGLSVAIMCMVASAAYAGTAILPMGQFSSRSWTAKYLYMLNSEGSAPVNWYEESFDDSAWGTIQGPLGLNGRLATTPTKFQANNASYWTRRTFTLTAADMPEGDEAIVFTAIHDDVCTAYLNGVQIYNGTGAITDPTYVTLTGDALAALHVGVNVLAVYVRDTGSYASMDYGLYRVGTLEDFIVRSDVNYDVTTNATREWHMEGLTAMVRADGTTTKNTAWLSVSYVADAPTEFSFNWACYNWSNHSMQLYIDGVQQNNTTNGSYTAQRYNLPAGEHVVAFRDTLGNNADTRNWSGIRNVKIKKTVQLENAALSANSAPLTFVNNGATPWTNEGEYIEHNNWWKANQEASITSTFTVTETSIFKHKRRSFCLNDTYYNREDYHQLIFSVNGVQINRSWGVTEFAEHGMVLEPGEYTVEWRDIVYSRGDMYYSQLKDIELSSCWQTVELATVGTLGFEALSLPAYNVLEDVEMLKVIGPMNASDWTDIKNMTNLKALDLSQAQITEIPNNAFDGKSWINSVILPEGLTRIGDYSFRGTNIRRIHIPSTVKTIAQYAFYNSPLQYLTFANNSQIETIAPFAFAGCSVLQSVDFGANSSLSTIDNAAFTNCKALQEIVIPNSVTSLGYAVFQDCTALRSIVFPNTITFINDHMCSGCSSLEQVQLPPALERINYAGFNGTSSLKSIDIPSTLYEIRGYAFQNSGLESIALPVSLEILHACSFNNCTSLKRIELPSYLSSGDNYYLRYYWSNGSGISSDYGNEGGRYYGYYRNFINCPALETVVMRSATPPTITSDPFAGSRAKSQITLIVPSFSVVNYKLDTYWYQFGSIIEGDDVDYWKLTSPLMLTNNRRMNGTPDVDLYFGGQLTVGGSAPMTMGQFNYFVNESNPGRLLNTCNAVSATAATSNFAAAANTWSFFTPLHDVTVADISVSDDASYVFRYYDAQNRANNGPNGSWKNVDTSKLLAGQGYIFHCNKACTITFPMDATGQAQLFRTTDVTQALTTNESATAANRSWNYIGNPYPTYFDIYYIDFSAPITVWTGSTYKAYSIADDDFVLRPMQSFFVQKPDGVDNIVFRKEGRQLSSAIERNAAVKAQRAPSGATPRSLFNLAIASDAGQVDETRVVVNAAATAAYDMSLDAAKFMSFDVAVPQLLTLDDDGNAYAINERPLADGEVVLAYYAGQAGTYTISALRADGRITLHDSETGSTVDLTESAYTFTSEATEGVNAARFMLKISDVATDVNAVGNGELIKENGKCYDLSGREIVNRNLPKGIYIHNGRKVVK